MKDAICAPDLKTASREEKDLLARIIDNYIDEEDSEETTE